MKMFKTDAGQQQLVSCMSLQTNNVHGKRLVHLLVTDITLKHYVKNMDSQPNASLRN